MWKWSCRTSGNLLAGISTSWFSIFTGQKWGSTFAFNNSCAMWQALVSFFLKKKEETRNAAVLYGSLVSQVYCWRPCLCMQKKYKQDQPACGRPGFVFSYMAVLALSLNCCQAHDMHARSTNLVEYDPKKHEIKQLAINDSSLLSVCWHQIFFNFLGMSQLIKAGIARFWKVEISMWSVGG